MDYWDECISCALADEGIDATVEQIKNIAGCVEIAHENYGMAHGHDVICKNHESEEAKELKELKKRIKAKEEYENSTEPCKRCNTTGFVKDVWGRDVECLECDGKGRVRIRT